ncbi:MAG: ABC transporter ATP-binding protein [Candidatus Cloacimonadota bacterium]|nr:MAG: ABC transporter ATP-binding protein [Candidatus Cloacimonadota bacterium]PIE77443.1 MAG: ABC transporter ATP-binding protein [Candidatus Delongbacteria bacterium]
MEKRKIVEIKDLSKVFNDESRGEVKAVNGVTFNCYEGEVFGLLGPNGAGKTTTLRMISTLMTPTKGDIIINGYNTKNDPDNVRKSMGFMSTTTALYPRLTPREILSYFCSLNSYPNEKISERVNEIISYFNIGDYADTHSEKLSTGMKQITSIGRSLVHNPSLVVLDEPNSGLDVINAIKIQKYIRKIAESGKTVLFSSHNMGEVEKICDRIGIISKGELLAIGTLEELREMSGKHYMEDIFVHFVEKKEQEN